MNKEQIIGRVRKTKGLVMEFTGKALGDKQLEAAGKMEKVAGRSQAVYGDLKNILKTI